MALDRHAAVPCVGVAPGHELARRRRLFDALGASFGVTFAPRDPGAFRFLDAAVVFAGPAPEDIPSLVLAPPAQRSAASVLLHDTPGLDPRLRGCTLDDRRAAGPPLAAERGDLVLASSGGAPVWLRRANGLTRLAVVSGPDELDGEESVRDQLVDGCFLGLLPLVELLRATGGARWTPPPPRASFVLDDPNLHRPTYGHVDFRELAAHAGRHGYHVAVATVPADHWLVSRRAAETFRRSGELSLAVHGNGHLHQELARPLDAAGREALVAQALRRAESLERRAHVPVSRVMVAPHERCSDEMANTLLRSEVEALCYGWGVRSAARPLADWEPVDLRGGGLPVLPRRPLSAPRGELALRAYLDQPLILGLHHGDLAAGLDVLTDAAAELDRIAEPQWLPLDAIARAGVSTLRDGSTLRVRPYARRFTVNVPAGSDAVVVELPVTHAAPERELLVLHNGVQHVFSGRTVGPLPAASGEPLELSLRRIDSFDHRAVPSPRPNPWTIQRRLIAEGRDRLTAVGSSRRRRARARR